MSRNVLKSNNRRILEEAISLEAWHSAFSPETDTASIHVDIVFSEVRLGQEDESPVRFKLMIRRAEVVIVIPPTEPLQVLQTSVSREHPTGLGTIRSKSSVGAATSLEASATLSIKPTPILRGKASASSATQLKKENTIEIETPVRMILSTQSRSKEGYYRWELKPVQADALLGKPWDAVSEPRLSVKDLSRKLGGIEGTSRVEIRCKREDLMIEDVTIKDRSMIKKLIGKSGYHNKIIAAESYIRSMLFQRDLPAGDMAEPYSDVCLAEIVIEPLVG
jgi:hypothetical protein